MNNAFEALFTRNRANPILTASMWPYPAHAVLNPGATLLKDGTTLLLCRVEDRRGISHLTAARSANGIDGWAIDEKPTFAPDPENHPEELWGVEDPRITYVNDLKKYCIAFTAYTKSGPGVALALTEDFVTFERCGLVMQPSDKDAALFPCKFNGNYALIHRPATESSADMWLSHSPDLTNWGSHQLMLPARRGAWWDAFKLGLACPPIHTKRGWLVLYHGVRTTASGSIYRLGLALFDLKDPAKGILRGHSWMFGPEEPYELVGDVANVVFPCGYTVMKDNDTIHLYYGAADTCIAMATGSIANLLEWLDEFGTEYIGIAGQPAERAHFAGSEVPN